ncbi:MAG TPA: hypothetical protein VFS34_15785 [Thermoanaerobaculia bacterium]|nr:hypothetical protein [Thermoanaerobaculia bacterium]
MIVYEGTTPPSVRRGEFHPFPGARARIRALPYPAFEPAGADPWRGAYRRGADAVVAAAAGSPDLWEEALRHAPAGKILVGPVPPAELVYGAAGAAVAAARRLGRAVVLVETARREPDGIPSGADLARVAVWDGACSSAEFWRAFGGGAPAGVAVPWIPGWTGEEEFLEAFFARARDAGARFAVGFPLAGDGPSRAAIHADFAERHPGRADAFFDAIHHRDWDAGTRETAARFVEAAGRAGVPVRVPFLLGGSEFEANVRLIDAFEEEARTGDEPRASALLAAARRVEDFGRDVADLEREGNLRILWPPDSPEARLARAVLAGSLR